MHSGDPIDCQEPTIEVSKEVTPATSVDTSAPENKEFMYEKNHWDTTFQGKMN